VRTSSSDRPTQYPTTRIGLVRTIVTANMYRVTIDNATITAHWAGTVAKVRGERVQVRFDPEKRYWTIVP
jgi:hypothetical protein